MTSQMQAGERPLTTNFAAATKKESVNENSNFSALSEDRVYLVLSSVVIFNLRTFLDVQKTGLNFPTAEGYIFIYTPVFLYSTTRDERSSRRLLCPKCSVGKRCYRSPLPPFNWKTKEVSFCFSFFFFSKEKLLSFFQNRYVLRVLPNVVVLNICVLVKSWFGIG